jgi:hypothetical protein
MALYLVSYDIPEVNEDEYQELWNYFASLGSVKILFSEYAVPFNGRALELTDKLTPHLRPGDRLFVCELFDGSGGSFAWHNLKLSTDDFRKLLTNFARTLN